MMRLTTYQGRAYRFRLNDEGLVVEGWTEGQRGWTKASLRAANTLRAANAIGLIVSQLHMVSQAKTEKPENY